MTRYLAKTFSKEKLTAELSDSNAAFYFATTNNKVTGYIKLNSGASQTEIQDNSALEIERIYVLKSFWGKRIRQLLYEKALQVASAQNAAYVWEKTNMSCTFIQKTGLCRLTNIPFNWVEFCKQL